MEETETSLPKIKECEALLNKECSFLRDLLEIKTEGPLEKKLIPLCARLLSTAPIQSLKKRAQLGLLKSVDNDWRNTKHTRFDHTVGVVAKGLVTCDLINSNQKKEEGLEFNEVDVKEFVVAATLHDCGHLPISHAAERAFFSTGKTTRGVSHEERIIPLLLMDNQYFSELTTVIKQDFKLCDDSLLRIASIIDAENWINYTKKDFILPKKAIQQLLVSEIDLDRLDYILRDAGNLSYEPVCALRKQIVTYLKYLRLERATFLTSCMAPKENVELCILNENDNLDTIFHLLVSRVLMYKNVYFSEKVRSFETILTNVIESLLHNKVSIKPILLIAMSDEHFIHKYLEERASFIDDPDEANRIKDSIQVLKQEKSKSYILKISFKEEDISHPRLREEFNNSINDREYIRKLKDTIIQLCKNEGCDIELRDLMFDVFSLKTGGGDLLVKDTKQKKYLTLKNYMNGSNMHRLCTEKRLDLYLISDLAPKKVETIKDVVKEFFNKNY